MLQYEIARIQLPPVPAALTMAGPNPNFNPPHASGTGIVGTDLNSCGPTSSGGDGTDPTHLAGDLPAIGTTTDVGNPTTGESASQVATDSENTISNALQGPGVKTGNYNGAGCTATQAAAGGDVQNVIGVSPGYNTVDGLNALVQSVIGSADQVATSSSQVSDWGTPSDPNNPLYNPADPPRVIAITGDATAQSGAGILLVTGNMTTGGGFTWSGLILVVGTGSVTFDGKSNIQGSVVVANIGNSSYATDPTNSANLLSQLGSPSYTWNGGGNGVFQYDSCATLNASTHAAYKVLARREIVY